MRKSRIASVLVAFIISAFSIRMISARGFSGVERTGIPGFFVRHHSVDAGRLSGTTPLQTTVELINQGPTVMRVDGAQPDCGCSSVTGAAVEVPPNGRAVEIPVTVDVNALPSGKFLKSVFFIVSDGAHRHGQFVFQVGGSIDRSAVLATLDPIIDFGAVGPGSDARRTLYLSGPAGLIRSAPPTIEIEDPSDKTIELSEIDSSRAQLIQAIRIHLHVSRAWSGHFRFVLSFHSPGFDSSQLRVPVMGECRNASFAAMPPRLLITPDVGHASVSIITLPLGIGMRDISIHATGPVACEVQEMSADSGDAAARVQLKVRYAGRLGTAPNESNIHIESANPPLFLDIPAVVLPPQRPISFFMGGDHATLR